MKLARYLKVKQQHLEDEIQDWMAEQIPITVYWKKGKYKGREANIVIRKCVQDPLSREYYVEVLACTISKRNRAYALDDNDSYHRTYRRFDEWFEVRDHGNNN